MKGSFILPQVHVKFMKGQSPYVYLWNCNTCMHISQEYFYWNMCFYQMEQFGISLYTPYIWEELHKDHSWIRNQVHFWVSYVLLYISQSDWITEMHTMRTLLHSLCHYYYFMHWILNCECLPPGNYHRNIIRSYWNSMYYSRIYTTGLSKIFSRLLSENMYIFTISLPMQYECS